jgi:hypothetical protein
VWDNLAGVGQGLLTGLESGLDLVRQESSAERSPADLVKRDEKGAEPASS